MLLISPKILVILVGTSLLSGCFEYSQTKQIGDSNICIPNQFMLNLGSNNNDGIYDETPSIYEGVSIDSSYVQQKIPEYQGTFGQGNDKRYEPLSITITQYQPYNNVIPESKEHDYYFSNPNPNLVGHQTDPNDFWDVYEIQPDQSRTYWGFCSYYIFNPDNYIQCRRSLHIDKLLFEYSVSRSNIDQYPKIDAYIREKVDTEWRCR